ncbi:hypothetical protein [Nonomuraea jiangxiensis]|uniref:hypothetical protein n=1 Tax=Nonomuraea jiangxiensis TaxID=633440 RepID=UPI0015A2DCA3|nr:hypothetical protein [Nonomuraea jiangxiensis]
MRELVTAGTHAADPRDHQVGDVTVCRRPADGIPTMEEESDAAAELAGHAEEFGRVAK